jgi:methyl-accepting chemotaxis protein
MLLLGTFVAVLLSIYIVNSIIRPLSALAKELSVVDKNKDLSTTLANSGNDEITQVIDKVNNMLATFKVAILEVSNASDKIAVTAEETSVVSTQIQGAIEEQASHTASIATAINQMSATVKEIANSSSTTFNSSNEANNSVQSGAQLMQQTIATINLLAQRIEGTSDSLLKLNQSSNNISNVLEVINSIAEQTNLLALNAAIEAARAGEQGRGFAVVADEVRALAGRTQESIGEISGIIAQLQRNSQSAVESIEQSHQQVGEVVQKAQTSGQLLNTITDSIANINDMNSHIASSCKEQEMVTEEINLKVVNINDKSHENASAVTQCSESGVELVQFAVDMRDLVAKFKLSA